MVGEEGEREAVRRCLSGETEAFAAIVDRYQRGLYNLALRMTGRPEDARDLTQRAFIRAYERLGRYDPGQPLGGWLYRIAARECLNFLRFRRRTEPLAEWWPAGGPSPERRLLDRERARVVRRALLALRPADRLVILLRHYVGLPYEAIGGQLGVSAGRVKSRLFTARDRLRNILRQTGVLDGQTGGAKLDATGR